MPRALLPRIHNPKQRLTSGESLSLVTGYNTKTDGEVQINDLILHKYYLGWTSMRLQIWILVARIFIF